MKRETAVQPGVLVLLALWVALWAGMMADPWDLRVLGPLSALAVAAALVIAGPVRAMRPPPWPLALLLAYALVGLAASVLMSPKMAVSLYWGLGFLATVIVAWLFTSSPAPVARTRLLVQLTLVAMVALFLFLLVIVIAGFDLLGNLARGEIGRLFSTLARFEPLRLVNANGVGRYAAIAALILGSRFLAGQARWLSMLLVALALLLLAYTVSRAALLGLAVAGLFLLWLHLGPRRTGLALGAAAIVGGIVVGGAGLSGDVEAYFVRGQSDETFSTLTGRTDIWSAAWDLFLASPWIGSGFHADRFFLTAPWQNHVHQGMLHAMVQSGLIGGAAWMGAWLATWALLFRLGLRRRFAGLAAPDRLLAIEVTVLLAFFGVRGLMESSGAFFGVDLLVLVPMLAYVSALDRASSPAGTKAAANSPRLRLLLAAMACAPGTPGWGAAVQAARRHDVWLVTEARQRPAVEAALARDPQPWIRWCYVEGSTLGGSPPVLRTLRWRLAAFACALDLHERAGIELVHDLTPRMLWLARVLGAFLPVPHLLQRDPPAPGEGEDPDPHGDRLDAMYRASIPARAPAAGTSPPAGSPLSYQVLGTRLAAVTRAQALAQVERWVHDRERRFVCVCSVNNVMTARSDAVLRRAHETAGMNVPDGAPLARLGRRRAAGRVERVRGTDFTLALAKVAAAQGWRVFLYGGAPGVAERAAEALQKRCSGFRLAGTHSPPFRPLHAEESARVVELINGSKADLVLVGLSTPKQEHWMLAHRAGLEAPVLVGVGAAFDFIAGTKAQAPPLLREHGVEWLWRFLQEPRRLWRRVLVQGPLFLSLVLLEDLRRLRRSPPPSPRSLPPPG